MHVRVAHEATLSLDLSSDKATDVMFKIYLHEALSQPMALGETPQINGVVVDENASADAELPMRHLLLRRSTLSTLSLMFFSLSSCRGCGSTRAVLPHSPHSLPFLGSHQTMFDS